MSISQFEYAAELIRFAVDNKVVVGASMTGCSAIGVAIKRGLEHWLFDTNSNEDSIASNRSIASIVGSDDASAAVDLLRSDLEHLTKGKISPSASESDGHHTPDQLAKRWYQRWRE